LGLIDNLIRTILIGARTRLHPLIVFFSVLGGVFLIGPLGLLLGPVVIVIAFFLLEILKLKLVNNKTT
ncbi:MAG: AI-2E family transporter, partial [Candidatus Melainabacteria bacterium]|nr:AI-2E family transporter [Candidatus Melainabacteria bacterium]